MVVTVVMCTALLQCRDFSWYLDTVWPQHSLPRPDQFFGRLVSKGEPGRCLGRGGRGAGATQSQQVRICNSSPNHQYYDVVQAGPASLELCQDGFTGGPGQLFSHQAESGSLATDENLCLDAPQWRELESGVRLAACSQLDRQAWDRY